MDLIKTDQYGRQIGYVQGANIDFEVGADEADSINDFEIELKRWNWDGSIRYGTRVFSPDTEYGGIVREISTDTSTNVIRAKRRYLARNDDQKNYTAIEWTGLRNSIWGT